jgi:hypothetical protein
MIELKDIMTVTDLEFGQPGWAWRRMGGEKNLSLEVVRVLARIFRANYIYPLLLEKPDVGSLRSNASE